MTGDAGAGAAAYAAMINAVKASGTIVEVEPDQFLEILSRSTDSLVVHSPASFMVKFKYITSYKGLCFYTKSPTELPLPGNVELVSAKKIWVPT